tara:strand:+ start:22415 stop:22780 length:366 start_codon:yes stop_codon:yes gene_type:complete
MSIPQPRRKFKNIEPGSIIFCIPAGQQYIAERTVKSIEGYAAGGRKDLVLITVFQNIQKVEEFSEAKVIEMADKMGSLEDIQTFNFAAPKESTFVHLPLLFPEPWCTSKQEIEEWMTLTKR